MRALAVLALLCAGCSFEAEKPNVLVTVHNVSDLADHLDVTLTLPDNSTKTFRPSFQPGAILPETSSHTVELAFTVAPGPLTVKIQASDRTMADDGDGQFSDTVPATGQLVREITLTGP